MGWKLRTRRELGPESVDTWEYDDNHGGRGRAFRRKGRREGHRDSCEFVAHVRGNGFTTDHGVGGYANDMLAARLLVLQCIAAKRRELADYAEQDARNFEHDIESLKAEKAVQS